ncbi:MAG: hypothetical protein P8O91_09520 [Luminiphilus sp.]|nr:hypothetical protein [Luminiphilus sp.]
MNNRGKVLSGLVTTSSLALLVYFLSEITSVPAPDICQQTISAAALADAGSDQDTLVDNAIMQQSTCEENAETSDLR